MGIARDVGLFGTSTRTNVLLLLALLGESHARELARVLGATPSNITKAIDSLDQAGVVKSVVEGNTRRISINPRYPYRSELMPLLEKMATSHLGLVQAASDLRRRPRRQGKEL